MERLIDRLAWDSEFFGVPMGRVALDDATPEVLDAIDDEARDLGLSCVVGYLDPHRSDATQAVQAHGHRLVEAGILLARPPGPFEVPPTTATARRGTVDDLAHLGGSIEALVPWSRFSVDPRFGPDATRRLFVAWADRAARATDDDFALFVAEDGGEVVGFATLQRHPTPLLDVMGVVHKGSGASWALMEQCLRWADADGALEAGPAAVRNLAPLRFCEHCGYHAGGARYIFHRWYDEPVG